MHVQRRTASRTIPGASWFLTLSATVACSMMSGCATIHAPGNTQRPHESNSVQMPLSVRVSVHEASFDCDLYLPRRVKPAPLVVVAHGFSRSRSSMADWGRYLSRNGFAVAVPTLPAWSDHARNGRAINEMVDWLRGHPEFTALVDADRVVLAGFSAGGLATLLAAAVSPRVCLWIGLDPVDRKGQGAAVAAGLECPSLILRAEPHAANAHGNAEKICGGSESKHTCLLVLGATHTDAEWPTDRMAEWVASLECT